MTTTTIEQLEKKIDELIRTHIADVRRTAAAAVERAFASGSSLPALAKSMGKTTAEQEPPVRLLKSTGKIRVVGERHGARYFPVAKST